MRISTILLSVALAFKTINSKAIDTTKDNDSFELVKAKNFTYKFHCSDEKELCDKVKSDLDYAFEALSNTFEFYQPVVFEAFVDDITLKYGYGSALAASTDLNYVSLKSSNDSSSTSYIYPQALAKQLNLNVEPNYKENDFILVINNFKTYPQIGDLRRTLIHEILHGFGFLTNTSLVQLDDNEIGNFGNNSQGLIYTEGSKFAIYPGINTSYSDKLLEIEDLNEYFEEYQKTKINKFTPISVFDKYLAYIETGEKLFDGIESYYEEINEKCLPEGSSLELKDLSNKFSKTCYEKLSPKTQEKMSGIENLFKINTTGFLTNDGEIVPLQTADYFYYPNSCLSHTRSELMDIAFYYGVRNQVPPGVESWIDPMTGALTMETISKYYDENFLLYMSVDDNLTVEQLLETVANNNKHGIIGQGIVKIMTTMGWTEKGEQKSDITYTVDEENDVPESKGFEYYIVNYIYKKMMQDLNAMPPQNGDNIITPEPSPVVIEVSTTVANGEVETSVATVEVETGLPSDPDSDFEAEITAEIIEDDDSDSEYDSECDDEEQQ